MKINIKRTSSFVRVHESEVDRAGWLGQEFAKRHPDLAQKWTLAFYATTTGWFSHGVGWEPTEVCANSGPDTADEIARLLRTPPPPPKPKHDCPSCSCDPECCN